jgi:stage IV sporulation protein FB
MRLYGYDILKIKLRISIFGVLMLLVLIFGDDSVYTLIALSAAAVHETGHIIAAALLKVKIGSFSLSLYGARLGLAVPLYSYRREWLLSAAGPAANIVSGGIAYYIYRIYGGTYNVQYVLFFAIASFFLAALNLLPIKNFDGGRMLLCVTAPTLGLYNAEKITEILSFIFVLIIWAMSLYLMLRVGSSLTMFVFSSALFAELFFDPGAFSQ